MMLPNPIPEPYRLLARALAMVLVLGWLYAIGRYHGAERVRGLWAVETAALTKARLAAEQAARLREQAFIQQLQKAEYDAAEREKILGAAADAAAATAGQLRGTVADLRNRLSNASVEACRATADAALAVFGECAERYRSVAAAADGHASDVKTLSEAWPQ